MLKCVIKSYRLLNNCRYLLNFIGFLLKVLHKCDFLGVLITFHWKREEKGEKLIKEKLN